tara:strand:- start:1813 stop:2418 length:606 start_codon:yes stop_codon:yes gene_type:complete
MLNGLDKIDLTSPDALEQINALAKGLADKNTELLGKVSGKDDVNASEAARVKALEDFQSNAEIKAAQDAQNWEEATRLQNEKHQKEIDDLSLTGKTDKELITKLLIEDGLNKALDGVKINPALKVGAEALLRSGAIITDGKAMIGDKSLSDAVNEWAASDTGKAYCLAPNNSGGDGLGGGGSGQGKELTLTEKSIAANNAK